MAQPCGINGPTSVGPFFPFLSHFCNAQRLPPSLHTSHIPCCHRRRRTLAQLAVPQIKLKLETGQSRSPTKQEVCLTDLTVQFEFKDIQSASQVTVSLPHSPHPVFPQAMQGGLSCASWSSSNLKTCDALRCVPVIVSCVVCEWSGMVRLLCLHCMCMWIYYVWMHVCIRICLHESVCVGVSMFHLSAHHLSTYLAAHKPINMSAVAA
jgi:hypothetical protein